MLKPKEGRGRPRRASAPINVRFPLSEIVKLDEWLVAHGLDSRPAAIRQIVRKVLEGDA